MQPHSVVLSERHLYPQSSYITTAEICITDCIPDSSIPFMLSLICHMSCTWNLASLGELFTIVERHKLISDANFCVVLANSPSMCIFQLICTKAANNGLYPKDKSIPWVGIGRKGREKAYKQVIHRISLEIFPRNFVSKTNLHRTYFNPIKSQKGLLFRTLPLC